MAAAAVLNLMHLHIMSKAVCTREMSKTVPSTMGTMIRTPTAKNINDMINGNYIGGKTTNIDMPYVIDLNGNIILGKRNGNGREGAPTPHPTLIGGKDPQVQMAGIVHIQGGKIASYDNQSGHYKPSSKSMSVADEAFGKLPSTLFKKKKGQSK